MLIDYQYEKRNKQLIISYIDEDGKIVLDRIPWSNPKKYVVCDENDVDRDPKYHTWNNKPVKKVLVPETENPDKYAIYEFIDSLDKDYTEKVFKFNIPNIYFIDIETEIVDGFPDAETALTQVLSISVVYDNKIILMGLKELSKEQQKRIINKTNKHFEKFGVTYKFKYMKYECEFDMLHYFFNEMVPKMECLTGWNFTEYDWKYLINRCDRCYKIVNGKEYKIDPRVTSPTRYLGKVFMKDYVLPKHRLIYDYMLLFKSLDQSIPHDSLSLDYVATELLDVKKIESNGSLKKLYEDDFETFMFYNAVDSVLVKKIHDKMDYISIIYAISNLANIAATSVVSTFSDSLGSNAITEGVLRRRFREQENIVLFNDITSKDTEPFTLAGGWVKEPVFGMTSLTTIYDFASLYPWTQMQFFISPENLVGVVLNKDDEYTTNGVKVDKDIHVVLSNNVVFKKEMSPTLQMLESVYKMRKDAKKKMMVAKEQIASNYKEIKELKKMLEETL